MVPLLTAVIVVALLVFIISSLAMVVTAFRQSVLWGLAYVFVPFASLIFTVRFWSEVKTSFLINVVSLLAAFVALVMHPSISRELLAGAGIPLTGSGSSNVEDLTAKIQERRDRIFQMETDFAQGSPVLVKQFSELEKKRKALNLNDTAAVEQFNEEAAAYQEQNAKRKVMLQELDAARQDLSNLLAERSRLAVPSSGSESVAKASSQRVVMYTTARCPACKAAKQYMAQRGISYDEKDVETVPSYLTEFQQLGGRGVPLILVGDKRMEGFSPKAFEQML